MEEVIKEMGYAFRDLTYHSGGEYSCRLGQTFLIRIKGQREFWGKTPKEALLKAKEALDEYFPDE